MCAELNSGFSWNYPNSASSWERGVARESPLSLLLLAVSLACSPFRVCTRSTSMLVAVPAAEDVTWATTGDIYTVRTASFDTLSLLVDCACCCACCCFCPLADAIGSAAAAMLLASLPLSLPFMHTGGHHRLRGRRVPQRDARPGERGPVQVDAARRYRHLFLAPAGTCVLCCYACPDQRGRCSTAAACIHGHHPLRWCAQPVCVVFPLHRPSMAARSTRRSCRRPRSPPPSTSSVSAATPTLPTPWAILVCC